MLPVPVQMFDSKVEMVGGWLEFLVKFFHLVVVCFTSCSFYLFDLILSVFY